MAQQPTARVGLTRATRCVFLSFLSSENPNLPRALIPFPLLLGAASFSTTPPLLPAPSFFSSALSFSSPLPLFPPFITPRGGQATAAAPSLPLPLVLSSLLSSLLPDPNQASGSSVSWPNLVISWSDLTDPEPDLLPTLVYPPRNVLLAFLLANQLSRSSEKISETTCLGSPKQIFGLRTADCE